MVGLAGTLNNTGATLTLSPNLGFWTIRGGTLIGGTIASSGGSYLALSNVGGTLSGVTIASGTTVDATVYFGFPGGNTTYNVTNGLTLNGTLKMGSADGSVFEQLHFLGSQSLSGTGTVVFGGYNGNALYAQGNGGSNPATLTIGSGINVQGGSGFIGGYNSNDSVVFLGSVAANTSGEKITVGNSGSGNTLSNFTSITAGNAATISIPESLQVNGSSIATVSPNNSLTVAGNLLGTTQNPALFKPQGTVTLNGSGTSSSPQLLEAMSADLGSGPSGFTNNFAYGTLILGNNTYVKLVNQSVNAPGSSAEAAYANSLVVPTGCTLNLNGLNLYVRDAQITGTITGGSITQIPNSGPLTIDSPTPGHLSTAGELDDWTFFERGGNALTVALDPGSGAPGGPISPTLQWAQVQLLDPSGNVLATTSSTTAGAVLTLSNVALPTDGTYTIAVKAASSHVSSTGNYVVAAYDVTTNIQPLNVNQTTTGTIATPYSTDQWTFAATQNTLVQFNLLAESASGLNFTLTGPNGFTGFSNITGSSVLVTLPTTGTYTLTVQGTGGATGNYTFVMAQTSQTPLTLGTPYSGTFAGSGQAQLFSVNTPVGEALSIQLSDPTSTDHTELYAQFANAPTRATYDYGTAAAGSSHSLLVPLAAPGVWYVLVYAENVNAGDAFTLTASAAPVLLTGATPNSAGNSAPTTMTISGAGFVAGTTVSLVASDGTTTYSPSSFSIVSFSQITATFPANLPPDTYSLRATNAGGSYTQANALTVSATGSPHFTANLILPSALGRHATATLYVQYANTGTVAMPAPLLVLSNTNNQRPLMTLDLALVKQGFWTSAIPDGFSTTISILASGKTPGILQPGESVTVPVYYAGLQQPWNFNLTTVPLNLGVVATTDTTPIDWTSLQSSLQPSWLDSNTWNAVYGNLVAQAGSTSGSYVQMLDNNAQYLGQLGESVTDVGQLWNFSLMQAVGLSPVEHLSTPIDLSLPAPGMALSFGRMYHESLDKRYAMSTLGYGWSTAWQESLAVQSDGTVVITTDGGDQNRYQPDSRYPGTYFSEAGDSSTLTAGSGGTFILTDARGNITAFRADGQLAYVKDTNGNTITAGYNSAGQMTSLTDSSGASLTFTYNGAGLVASVSSSQIGGMG